MATVLYPAHFSEKRKWRPGDPGDSGSLPFVYDFTAPSLERMVSRGKREFKFPYGFADVLTSKGTCANDENLYTLDPLIQTGPDLCFKAPAEKVDRDTRVTKSQLREGPTNQDRLFWETFTGMAIRLLENR